MSAASVLREYGQAVRGDWSEIDGRTVLGDMDTVADWIEALETYPGDENARLTLGICVAGGGHWCGRWYGYCGKDCGCPEDGGNA